MHSKWTLAEFYVSLWVVMHWYTCKSLLNTLAWLRKSYKTVGYVSCQASSSWCQSITVMKSQREALLMRWCNRFKTFHMSSWIGHTHIAPPTGCGFHPAPYATLSNLPCYLPHILIKCENFICIYPAKYSVALEASMFNSFLWNKCILSCLVNSTLSAVL